MYSLKLQHNSSFKETANCERSKNLPEQNGTGFHSMEMCGTIWRTVSRLYLHHADSVSMNFEIETKYPWTTTRNRITGWRSDTTCSRAICHSITRAFRAAHRDSDVDNWTSKRGGLRARTPCANVFCAWNANGSEESLSLKTSRSNKIEITPQYLIWIIAIVQNKMHYESNISSCFIRSLGQQTRINKRDILNSFILLPDYSSWWCFCTTCTGRSPDVSFVCR